MTPGLKMFLIVLIYMIGAVGNYVCGSNRKRDISILLDYLCLTGLLIVAQS